MPDLPLHAIPLVTLAQSQAVPIGYWMALSAAGAVALGGGILSGVLLLQARRAAAAIERIRYSSRRLADGELNHRLALDGPHPVGPLAQSLNVMATELERRFETVSRQRNELDAVLASMVEGVIAVDRDEQVISLNAAAARMLHLSPTASLERSIQEVVRNAPLQAFIAQTLRQPTPNSAQIVLRDPDALPTLPGTPAPHTDRLVQLQGARLRDAAGGGIGAVVVMHDLTELRRLEAVRRDFVANVSHEVKTPVAAIQAAVETLLDERGMEDDPESAQRFLQIIRRQALRLEAIVEDLLSLARLERNPAAMAARMESGPVAPILLAAQETCQALATARQITLQIDCPADLTARLDPALLEQAVVNLIDNAIKYSPEGRQVRVTAAANPQEVVIEVIDQGLGIEANHLPRVFERFYRTDPARSRASGGTGLGLAIVKHVAEAHGGRTTVTSVPGRGSTFRIHLQPGTGKRSSPPTVQP